MAKRYAFNNQISGYFIEHRLAPARRPDARRAWQNVRLARAGSARTTTRLPSGSLSIRSRIRCRSWRLTRLRSTADPTALLTTKPTDVGPPVPGTTCVTRVGCTPLAPRRIVCRKSSPLRMRWTRASNGSGRQLGATLAATVREDRAAGAGAHAEAEAVLLGTTTVVRLESTLAHDVFLTDLSLGRSTATARPRPRRSVVVGMRRKSF